MVGLLAQSLHACHTDHQLTVFSPLRRPRTGALSRCNVRWAHHSCEAGKGWNVKPEILIKALEDSPSALWLDSDVIVANPVHGLDAPSTGAIVVGQEFRGRADYGGVLRAAGWNIKIARTVPFHVNSGTILVNRSHLPLLRRWRELLSEPHYRRSQRRPIADRPIHMLGDQDVLWALLCSFEFADIEVRYFRNGVDVIQDSGLNGYHWMDRLRNGNRIRASFVHALGRPKPWEPYDRLPPSHRLKRELLRALSIYSIIAFRHAPELPWTQAGGHVGSALSLLFLGNRLLPAIPLAAAAELVDIVRSFRAKVRAKVL